MTQLQTAVDRVLLGSGSPPEAFLPISAESSSEDRPEDVPGHREGRLGRRGIGDFRPDHVHVHHVHELLHVRDAEHEGSHRREDEPNRGGHRRVRSADRADARQDHRDRPGRPDPVPHLVSRRDEPVSPGDRRAALGRGEPGVPAIPVSTLLYFILFFLFGYFLYASIYTAIGAPFNTDQEARSSPWFRECSSSESGRSFRPC